MKISRTLMYRVAIVLAAVVAAWCIVAMMNKKKCGCHDHSRNVAQTTVPVVVYQEPIGMQEEGEFTEYFTRNGRKIRKNKRKMQKMTRKPKKSSEMIEWVPM